MLLFNIYGLEDVRIDDANNVIGVRPGAGGGPTFVLTAHIDAVALWPRDQPINAFVADGRVWGPAAGDDMMGAQQLVTVLRALNAAKIQTKGDVWFVGLTGEEYGSPGAEYFAMSNQQALDWRKGAIITQLHGPAGEGVDTGFYPNRDVIEIRFFTPLDWPRWKPHSMRALVLAVDRIYNEVYDPKSAELNDHAREGTGTDTGPAPLFVNPSVLYTSPIFNGSVPQSSVRMDVRSSDSQRIFEVEERIRRIAQEVCDKLGPGFRYTFEVIQRKWGKDIDGFDKANSRAARVGAAAAAALYNSEPVIDADTGCGDCVRSFMGGVPAMSFRGSVREVQGKVTTAPGGLKSETRRRTAGHNVTESAEINQIWSGIKHALAFVATYSGLADAKPSSEGAAAVGQGTLVRQFRVSRLWHSMSLLATVSRNHSVSVAKLGLGCFAPEGEGPIAEGKRSAAPGTGRKRIPL